MSRPMRWIAPLVSIALGATIATWLVVCSPPEAQRANAAPSLVVSSATAEDNGATTHEPEVPAVQQESATAQSQTDVLPDEEPGPSLNPLRQQSAEDIAAAEPHIEGDPHAAEEPAGPADEVVRDALSAPLAQQAEAPAGPSALQSLPKELQELIAPVLGAAQQSPPAGASSSTQSANGPAVIPAPTTEPTPGASAAQPTSATSESRIGISPVEGEGDDQLRVFIKDEDIRVVLAALSEQGGLNILPSKSVQGTVSAALNGVTVETALDAILRSTGYVARKEGQFIYVGTPMDFDAMDHVRDRIGTRIYRPNYVSAAELVALITPLLTPAPVGKAVATSPSKVDIPADDVKTGGNDFAGNDAVLVQDYETVLAAIDQVVQEIDCRPAQVAIEAMILSVRLNDSCRAGIDFRFLADKNHLRLGIGQPQAPLDGIAFDGGLKFAFLDSDFGAFVDFLESIGDTNVIATPRLMVLNKHRAEILIGSQLGYVNTSTTETATTQSVNFLEVGAQLRLRPFISSDGLIRMEVHPELSTGVVRVEGGFTLPDKDVTQVTTNIIVRDGYTVVIGGLMREDLTTTTSQVPVVGNLPYLGALFRRKTEQIEKREILVLVTPRIVQEPWMYHEGEQGAGEFHRRQSVYRDHMSPLGKRHLGRKYFRLAQEAWLKGERERALKLVSMAIQCDPTNRAAIDLRADIWGGVQDGDHSGGTPLPSVPSTQWLDGEHIEPFILESLERDGVQPVEVVPAPAEVPSARRESRSDKARS